MNSILIGILFLVSSSVSNANSEVLNPDINIQGTKRVFDGVTAAQPVCYGREYSEAVLKARPKQTVQKIQAKLTRDDQYNQNILTVEITLRGKKNLYKNYRSMLFCDKDQHCYVECDGGSVDTKIQSDGTLLIKNNGFAIKGGCGDEDEEEGQLLKETEGGDDLFKLYKLPKEFCQKVPDDLRD